MLNSFKRTLINSKQQKKEEDIKFSNAWLYTYLIEHPFNVDLIIKKWSSLQEVLARSHNILRPE
jgi:hypothetical protein